MTSRSPPVRIVTMESSVPEQNSRRARERQLRRDAMLLAAQEVIAEKGYESATLEEIAQRAEFGKGTIYNYFPGGKEEILLAIFVQVYERLVELVDLSFDNTASFRTGLRSFLGQTFSFFLKRNDLFTILMREAFRLNTMASDPIKVLRGHSLEAVSRLSVHVSRAMERGELRRLDARILSHHILHSMKGFHMQQCGVTRCEPLPDPDDMADLVLNLIMDGVSTELSYSE